jgi:hypothetical protein
MNMQLPGLSTVHGDPGTKVTQSQRSAKIAPQTILGFRIPHALIAGVIQLLSHTLFIAMIGGAAFHGPMLLALVVWRASVFLAVYWIVIRWLWVLHQNLTARLEGDIFFAPVIELGRIAQDISGNVTAYLAGRVAHMMAEELRGMVMSVETGAARQH